MITLIVASNHEFNLKITGWLTVQRKVYIEWNLESTPLEVKTNSVLGSNEMAHVAFQSNGGYSAAGGVQLDFKSTPRYLISRCTLWTNIPVTLPSATDKVWRITLTKTAGVRLVIHCNNVEVLNALLSSTCSSGVWSNDVTGIVFESSACDYYRAGD